VRPSRDARRVAADAGSTTGDRMSAKMLIWMGAIAGSMVGGLLPSLWHASFFSLSGVIASTVGAVLGIWIAWKMTRQYL
jgi:uncharacterized membrane protein YeaQ/YmgE (transglycosylase-associated protein family)